jgi:hypothetical protein
MCTFFVAFFSATIDGRNLIFGHMLHINATKNILDGRTDRGKTVSPPPPSGSGGIIIIIINLKSGMHGGHLNNYYNMVHIFNFENSFADLIDLYTH